MSVDTTSVPTSYALSLIQAANDNGCDTDDLLRELGIDHEELKETRFCSAIKYGQLYQRLMFLMQDETFGMFSGGKVRNGSFRLMCLTVIHCSNLRQAMLRANEFCEICRGFFVKNELTEEDGKNYDDLTELYGQVLGQFNRYMGHVKSNIGGIYTTPKTYDQDGVVHEHVNKATQKD